MSPRIGIETDILRWGVRQQNEGQCRSELADLLFIAEVGAGLGRSIISLAQVEQDSS